MKSNWYMSLLAIILSACGTQQKVAPLDPKTGLLKSDYGFVLDAKVIAEKTVDLSKLKGLAFVSGGGNYAVEQLKAIGYFEEVVDYPGLQKLVVSKGLEDKVPTVADGIGLAKLYRAYKPFLWLTFKRVYRESLPYLQIIAINPENLEELFVAEIYLDFMLAGVHDQNSRYPLFNALITWISKNRGAMS